MIALAALTVTLAVLSPAWANPATAPAGNPHWAKDRCSDCHEMTGNTPQPIAGQSITPLCLKCHDGVKATDEAHPIGRLLNPQTMHDPGWPTLGGTVQCITCHDARQACRTVGETPNDNVAFVRQRVDDKGQPMAFCGSCHTEQRTAKLNPHRMLADGNIAADKCAICHCQPMDRRATTRQSRPLLIADQVTLCKSCHPHHKDIATTGHVGKTMPREMLMYARAREITGLLELPSDDLLKQLWEQHAAPTLMVPDSQGKVVCSTCHNPHQYGVFAPGSDLNDRSLRLVKGHLLTPIRGETFCKHCHNL